MTDPVVRWTTESDGLADVAVRQVSSADEDRTAAVVLRDNPFAALAVVVSPDRLVVRTELGHVLELTPLPARACCLDVEEVVRSVAQSLYAWHVARLDMSALEPRGLPVWCAGHRICRSTIACGWLSVILQPAQSLGDVVGS